LSGTGSGTLQIAIAAIALALVAYLAFLMLGFLSKVLFLAAATALGVVTWRAWRSDA
jgi:hypothetical protein